MEHQPRILLPRGTLGGREPRVGGGEGGWLDACVGGGGGCAERNCEPGLEDQSLIAVS